MVDKEFEMKITQELTELDQKISELMARRNSLQRQLEAYHLLTDRQEVKTG